MLGLFAILSAIYYKLSLPVLSFITDNHEAGNYATGTRVYQVVIALISTLTGVMIPRISILLKENRFDLVSQYTDTAFKLLFLFSCPIICFVELFAPDIIHIFAGYGYEGAILPMRIIMLQLIVIGAEKIIVLQLLIPLRKDSYIVKAGIAGVIVWAIMTVLLVPKYHSMGTAIVWIAAEATVLIFSAIKVNKELSIVFPFKLLILSIIYSAPYLLIGWGVLVVIDSAVLRIITCILLFMPYAYLLETRVYRTGILKAVSEIINKKPNNE